MSEPRLTNLKLYLQRLGFDAPPAPTLENLRLLQWRHTGVFPFENLATITGAPVLIDLPSIEEKILLGGRGGYCYELNNLFFTLLLELGFDARAISGRVVMNQPEGSWTARTHRLSLVTLDGVRYITDVGFGGMVPTAPLLLDTEAEQTTPHEPYRIDKQADGYMLQANVAGEWRPMYLFDLQRQEDIDKQADGYMLQANVAGEWRSMYLFDLQRQEDIDFTIGNWYVSAHPDSPFTQRLMAARTGDGWRKTLNNGSFALHRMGASSERREITEVAALIELLVQEFDIHLPDVPHTRHSLERMIVPAKA